MIWFREGKQFHQILLSHIALKNTVTFLIFCSDEGVCHGLYNVSDADINKNNVEGHNQ